MTDFWRGKRVLVTGHTGFKGSWMSLWLDQLGAKVFGYALEPTSDQPLFDQLRLRQTISHHSGDILDRDNFEQVLNIAKPDVVFHLAAQSLVTASFSNPQSTWSTNLMGSLNVLEALRGTRQVCSVVMVTTDKVYQNKNWNFLYRETDKLGGHDPYSASKAAMEIMVQSQRLSFFKDDNIVRIATARAGNVIGGGDGSKNRIMPDIIDALRSGTPVSVRNPNSVRPWQHVLEPLAGYMRLAQFLYEDDSQKYQTAYNIGPEASDMKTVAELVEEALLSWPGTWFDASDSVGVHEASLLSLEIQKARSELGITPHWKFNEAVKKTVAWYQHVAAGKSAIQISLDQIADYTNQ